MPAGACQSRHAGKAVLVQILLYPSIVQPLNITRRSERASGILNRLVVVSMSAYT